MMPVVVYPHNAKITMEETWKSPINDRMSHFLHSISNHDMMMTFNFLPYVKDKKFSDLDLFIPCCALRYMIINENLLSMKDIDAFLVTFSFVNSEQYFLVSFISV